jgi:hypothetical protein
MSNVEYQPEQTLGVRLSRPEQGISWGFRLQGGVDFSTPLSIQVVSIDFGFGEVNSVMHVPVLSHNSTSLYISIGMCIGAVWKWDILRSWIGVTLAHTHTHTHTHTHLHTRTHKRTHTHTHARAHIRTHTRTRPPSTHTDIPLITCVILKCLSHKDNFKPGSEIDTVSLGFPWSGGEPK